MADKLPAGTPITDASTGYTNYTAEQLEALQGMKDPAYTFGIARSEFVNTVLLPDGTHSTDLDAMQDAARGALADLLSGQKADSRTLGQAQRAAQVVEEIAEHVAANRFLFIVDENHQPKIYFRCVTPDADDLHEISPHSNDHPVLVADHPDQNAHAAQRDEVSTRIANIVDAAKKAARKES